MIRHCVFVNYQPSFGRAERDAIYADLAGLQTKVEGMLGFDAGRNVNPEGLGHGFDEGFLIDFRDAAARDAYLVHPEHQAIGARIASTAEGGVEGIFVFDLELT